MIRTSILPLMALLAGILNCTAAEVRLAGKVANENDAPLGGANLVLRRHGAADGLRVYTDPAGRYEARLPEPGAYLVDVESAGHFPLKARALMLAEGENQVDFTLNRLREVFESVDVSAAPPPIDLDTTTSQQTVSATEILNVPYPTSNDLRNALRIIPGVIQDAYGGLHVNGGAESQTQYTLNGFNITDPLTGRFETRLSVEAVQTVDVVSGRMAAEYGKGSAGVLAINTRTGDDKFRTSATNFVPSVEYRRGLLIGGWTPRFNFSGPIKRGRAWFSDAFDTQFVNTVIEDLPRGEDRASLWRISNHLNTQVNLTPSNILYTGFLVNFFTAPRAGLGVLDPRETTRDLRRRQWFFHVKDQIYLTSDILVEVGYAANRTFGREIPQGHGFYQMTPEGNRGNFFLDATRKASRDQVLANAFLPAFQLAGEHRVKLGLDLDRLSYWQDVRRTGYENYRRDYTLTRQTVFGGSGIADILNYETSLYLHDSWRVRPNLLVEAGIRGDWDHILHYWNGSPRVGFAWSPPRLTRTKLSGGYAMVYDATPLRIFMRPEDQYSLTTYFSPDGEVDRGPNVTVFASPHANLSRPRYRNYSLGWEQEWIDGVHTHLEYLRKRGRYGFTYVNTLGPGKSVPQEWLARFQNLSFDAIYGLTNDRRDVYDSIQATLRHVIRRQYEWMISYTRSRALSNAVVDLNIDDPIVVDSNVGPMPWDSPNRLLSWGFLPTPVKNWSVAYLIDFRTGFPFSIVNEDGHVVGNVNAQRFPAYFELNLHLERRFTFRKHLWALRGGCNNLTNHSNPNVVKNNMSSVQFLHFYGGADRSFNFRIRWLGKSS